MRLTLLAILGHGGDFSGESKQGVKEADFVYASFNLLIPSPAKSLSVKPLLVALRRMSKVLKRQPTPPVAYGLKASPSFPLAVAVSCSNSGFQLMEHPYLSSVAISASPSDSCDCCCVFFSNSCSNFGSKHQNNVLYL